MIDQLTVRGFEPDLSEKIEGFAKREGISLNKAVLKLLRRSVGLEAGEPKPKEIGDALDRFVGGWTEDEARQFDDALAAMRTIDEELWR